MKKLNKTTWILLATLSFGPRALGVNAVYTNVKDFGALGNGVHDDTTAVQNAINSAWNRDQAATYNGSNLYSNATVFFPAGTYRITNTLTFDMNLPGEGGAILKQDNSTKDILLQNAIMRCVISGLSFVGGRNQINVSNSNLNAGLIIIEKCQFVNAVNCAIKTATSLVGYWSTQFIVKDCVFTNCNQAFINYSDKGKIFDCWITSSPTMTNKAVLENHADLLCENLNCIPKVTAANDQRWIDNYQDISSNNGRVECRSCRFGGEAAGGGMTVVVNFAPFDYTYAVIPTAVVLDDCDIYAAGNTSHPWRGAAISCEQIPNQIIVQNCRGLPNTPVVKLSDNLTANLNAIFDIVHTYARAAALRYFIDPGTCELTNSQLDLPEQMRPYQANLIEADAVPTTGWWAAGQFVRNRNYPGTGGHYGWLCTYAGKPGTWYAVNASFTPQTAGAIQGQVVLDNYTDDLRYVSGKIELRQSGSVVSANRLTLDSGGNFTLSNLAAGTYDVALKPSNGLQKVITGVIVPATATVNIGTVELSNADVDGDNEITSSDLSIVLTNMDLVGDS